MYCCQLNNYLSGPRVTAGQLRHRQDGASFHHHAHRAAGGGSTDAGSILPLGAAGILGKPHTRKSYEATIKNHIKLALGKKRIQELTPVHIQQFVNHLKNLKNKRAPLNPKTVKNIHGVLHSALQQAFRIGYLSVNPSSLAILPKRTKAEITPLQDEQVAQFLCAIKGHPLENIYLVDLFTGIRQSELIGLE